MCPRRGQRRVARGWNRQSSVLATPVGGRGPVPVGCRAGVPRRLAPRLERLLGDGDLGPD
eukprot:5666012-Prymnesium_polylepis.1